MFVPSRLAERERQPPMRIVAPTRRRVLLTALMATASVLWLIQCSFAQDVTPNKAGALDGYTGGFATCMDAVDLGALKETQWQSCYELELQVQDKNLNQEYKQLAHRTPNEFRPMLVKAEMSWISYRETWCKYEASLPMAPSGPVNYSACLVDITIAQVKRIKGAFQ
jgi:uncharacterized protein YecT (DUF1311 family)